MRRHLFYDFVEADLGRGQWGYDVFYKPVSRGSTRTQEDHSAFPRVVDVVGLEVQSESLGVGLPVLLRS